ncbi:MAG: hypothetical protein AAGG68_20420, partial [Bacteroidota bacterium]
MSFSLDVLEQNVDEAALVQGEELFEQNAVGKMQMVEKNLWIARVAGLEVEVKATSKKVEAVTCECATYRQKGMCEHIVATLFLLRKKVNEKPKTTISKARKKTQKTENRLTTRSILKEIDEAALHRFVQDYAARDRNFALALKARFIGVVEFSDDKAKYIQILDDTIKAARKKDRNISYRGTQKLLKISDELFQQADLALVQSHYTSVAYIAQSVIEKFTSILRKVDRSAELRNQINRSFKLLQQLLEKPIPPDLLEQLWEYVKQEFTRITYRINEVVPQFYRLQRTLAEKLNKEEELLDLLTEFSFQMQYSDENYTRLLINRIGLLEKLGNEAAIDDIVKNNLQNPQLLLFVIRQALKKEDWKQAKSLTQKGLEQAQAKRTIAPLEEIIIRIAEQENDIETLAQYAQSRLLATYQLQYFEKLKKAYAGDWKEKLENLLKQIKSAPYSLAQRDLIASIYAEEKYYKELLEYVQKLRSLDILQQFDEVLMQEKEHEVKELYQQLLREYLEHHIGRKPAVRVREKLAHLYQIGARKLAKELIQEFRTTYRERIA